MVAVDPATGASAQAGQSQQNLNGVAAAAAQPFPGAPPPPANGPPPPAPGAQPSYPPIGVPQPAPPPPAAPPAGVPAGAVMVTLSPNPIPGMLMRPPRGPPQPGQVLLGYEVCRPEFGCFRCDGLSPIGLFSVIILLVFFWPLAFIPCLMPECYDPYQRPVYGWPAPPHIVNGQPHPQQHPPASAAPGYPPT